MTNSTTRILAIDDDEPILELIQAYLPGFELEVATSGAEGIATLERFRPNLVLLDVSMPVMDGIETLRRIRVRADRTKCTVVMMTAKADAATVAAARATGANGYILKPFTRELFMARVYQALGREVIALG